jgi:hypothetical protein
MYALKTLLGRCKGGVFLTVNEHKNYYDTIEKTLQDYAEMPCPPEFTEEVLSGIHRTGNVVDLQFYPDTPIGSYHIVHYDLDDALKIAIECVKEE